MLNPTSRKTSRPYSLRAVDGSVVSTGYVSRDHAIRDRIRDKLSVKNLDLRGVDLSEMDLSHVNFEGSNLAGANLFGTTGQKMRFDGCDLSGVQAIGVKWVLPSLRNARIGLHEGKPASFHGALFRQIDLEGAKIEGADFGKARLRAAKLVDASFSHANFKEADLSLSEHRGATYAYNDFSEATLASVPSVMRGVERRTWTEGVKAIGNIYDEKTVTTDLVPAFVEERQRTALTGKVSGVATTGVGIGAGIAAALAADKVFGLDWRGAAETAVHAAGGLKEALSDSGISHLGEGLRSLLTYATALMPRDALAAIQQGVSHIALATAHALPHLPDAPMVGHMASAALGIAVTAAAPAAINWTREKVRDSVRAYIGPSVGRLFDRLGAMVSEAAKRHAGYKDVVAALAYERVDRGLLVRALAATSPASQQRGEGPSFGASSEGPLTLVVCKRDHLQKALEAIAISWEARRGAGQDVVLVRAGAPGGDEPAALKFHADGGMTAFWAEGTDLREESWTASEIDPLSSSREDRPSDVRRSFENAILRDHAPELPFEFDSRHGRVSFRPDDKGFKVISDRGQEGRRVHVVADPEPHEEEEHEPSMGMR